MRSPAVVAALLLLPGLAAAQQGAPDLGARLLQEGSVKAALEAARADEARTLAEQVEIGSSRSMAPASASPISRWAACATA
jgi:hypothetical protein